MIIPWWWCVYVHPSSRVKLKGKKKSYSCPCSFLQLRKWTSHSPVLTRSELSWKSEAGELIYSGQEEESSLILTADGGLEEREEGGTVWDQERMEMSERKKEKGEIRTSQTGKTKRRGDEIMENCSRELGMKGVDGKSEAACPTLKHWWYDSCLRPNLRPIHSTDECLRLYQPPHWGMQAHCSLSFSFFLSSRDRLFRNTSLSDKLHPSYRCKFSAKKEIGWQSWSIIHSNVVFLHVCLCYSFPYTHVPFLSFLCWIRRIQLMANK